MKKKSEAKGKTLSAEDGKLFFSLWLPLLAYVNKRFSVVPAASDHTGAVDADLSDMLTIAGRLWDDVSLIDEYLAENKDIPEEHREIISGWKRARRGVYILERHLKGGSIFLSEDEQVYLVKGLQSSWEELLEGWRLPIFLDAVLIPFRGVIVTDGLLLPHQIVVGSNMTKHFRQVYMNAKDRGEIVETL